ncbi:MAG: hypothetical protein ACXWG8_06580, partial [Usitatibacter sp.]
MRIQAIDIVQPPGIGISSIDDMEPHHTTVATALAVNSSAVATGNVKRERRIGQSELLLVLALEA